MTTKELIEKLQELDPEGNKPVLVSWTSSLDGDSGVTEAQYAEVIPEGILIDSYA